MKNQETQVSTESTGVCTDHVSYVVEGKYFVTLDTKWASQMSPTIFPSALNIS